MKDQVKYQHFSLILIIYISLSAFNLGHLKEKENLIDESIEFYILVSEYEDEPFVFHNKKHKSRRNYKMKFTLILHLNNLKKRKFKKKQ